MLFIKKFRLVCIVLLLSVPAAAFAQSADTQARWKDKNINLAASIASSGRGLNSSVIDALKDIPRHRFTEDSYYDIAYEDISLPGADRGFIPSPSDVLRSLSMLSPSSTDKILIAGNNTGYAASILAGLAANIYMIEETAAAAEYPALFAEIGIDNITIAETADINEFDEIIAFDKIFICGAVAGISEKLTERLSIQGNITFILAEEGGFQQLVSMRRSLLGDSITSGGSCYFPEIKILKITN